MEINIEVIICMENHMALGNIFGKMELSIKVILNKGLEKEKECG